MNLLATYINSIFRHPIVKRWAAKFPRVFKFISERLSLSKFKGLPTTLLIVIFAANLFLFNEIAESIENSPMMLSIDNSFAQFLYGIRNNAAAKSFYYFSMLGSANVVITVALVAISIQLWQRQFMYLISLLVSLAGAVITVLLGKMYFHRVRPYSYSYYHETSYSFPSGHAIVAVAFYGLLFYLIIRHSEKYKLRWSLFAILFILLLGFSRLYLGVHFLSDVFAGYSLGLLWFLLSISIIEWKSAISTNWNKHKLR